MAGITSLRIDRGRLFWGGAFFAAWLSVVSVFGAYHLASHLLTLPPPSSPAAIAGSGWRAEHFLAAKCPCSQAIADGLLQRSPDPEMREHVTIVGADPLMAKALRAAGYGVTEADPETLKATAGVEGAPWLLVYEPTGRLAYSGGYAARRPGPGVPAEDRRIFRTLRAGQRVTSLPAYGCATSRALQKITDPLGVKYP